MKHLYLLFALLLISCNNATQLNNDVFNPNSSIEKLLIDRQQFIINEAKKYPGFYNNHKYIENEVDIIKSLKVIDQFEIPNTNYIAVFYSFNIGSDIIRESQYVMKENEKYYIFNNYFSSYDDDPFKNGEPQIGKKLLEKIDNWEEDNKNIIWY